jgi:hypothetical protein
MKEVLGQRQFLHMPLHILIKRIELSSYETSMMWKTREIEYFLLSFWNQKLRTHSTHLSLWGSAGVYFDFIRCLEILSRLFQIIVSSDWSSLLFPSCSLRHFQHISETCAQASTCQLVVAAGLKDTNLSDLKFIGSSRWIPSSCSVKCGECWTGVAGQIFENLECMSPQ